MGKKNCAIVLATTGNMTFALANVLIGLKKHSPKLADDIIVFEKGISDKDKQIINKIIPTTFVEYNFSLQTNSNQNNIDKYTSLAFSRYECFNMLTEYKNVIWLDTDILIKKDISNILSFAQETGLSSFYEYWQNVSCNFTQPIIGYDMDLKSHNSGILALNDNLHEFQKISRWCYEKTEELKEALKWPDQGILCLMYQEFNLKVNNLPVTYNAYPMVPEEKEAFIIHIPGVEKFWNFFDYDEWFDNYDKWLELGGTPGRVYRLTVLQQILYQKTSKTMNLWDNKKFINYMITRYGQEAINNAYESLIKLVLTNKIRLNDPHFEQMIKRKYRILKNK